MSAISSQLHGGYAHDLTRRWSAQSTALSKSMFMLPLFISDDPQNSSPLKGMPNQCRWGVEALKPYLETLVKKGLRSIILFGVPERKAKDETGTLADDPEGPVISAIKMIRSSFPDLYVAADVCLCEYTSHGHCGILHPDGLINNVLSVQRLAAVALAYAQAGAHCVAPSDMMDGRIGAIKEKLIESGLVGKTTLMAYSAKFSSNMYGPFREAVASAPSFGDRRCYQLPAQARGLARRAIMRDVNEGADIVMVKPGSIYLDIVAEAKRLAPDHPIAVYHVSGEYAALHAAAAAGVYDLQAAVLELSYAMARAGASIVLSYFTPELLDWLEA